MPWKTFRIVYTAFRAEKLETADRSGVFAASSGRCFPMDGNKGAHDISMFVPYPNNQIMWSWFGPNHFLVHLMSDALGIFFTFCGFLCSASMFGEAQTLITSLPYASPARSEHEGD